MLQADRDQDQHGGDQAEAQEEPLGADQHLDRIVDRVMVRNRRITT